ncbi:MAG: hypothetical protein AAF737_02120 [Pseudomonadota bacterium]
MKHALIVAIVGSALALTACGKKGEIVADDRIVKVSLDGSSGQRAEPEPKRDFVLDPLL